ncbi:MAG: hypothetical protein EXS09_10660 [Gemmataceae bacterium]|nr:hypothetical protein [Gemmataceae bacterium]
MPEVVRSTCPGCQRSLNIPADWVGKTVRCKHCGKPMLVQPASVPVAAQATVAMAAVPMTAPLPATSNEMPEYSPPMATAPIPQASAPQSRYVSAFDTSDRYAGRGQYSGPKKNRAWIKGAILVAIFSLVGVGGLFAAKKAGLLNKSSTTEPLQANNGGTNPQGTPGTGTPGEPAGAGAFPRRMLAISIHSYLYANPLHNGDSGFALDDSSRSGTDSAIRRLAERWKVPKEQLYHLTDARLRGEKGADAKPAAKKQGKVPPLRMVLEGTIEQFLNTSRAQDRIVIVFCGHIMEVKGEAFIVPIEGELDEVATLIPLKWFYEKVGACPAQEKVVIFDINRFHPERGIERPHPGPMSEALEKALHEPPGGVTVMTSCSKGEQAIELDYLNTNLTFDNPLVKGTGFNLNGSFFLSMIHAASIAGALSPEKKLPAPGDELPIERLGTWMKGKLGEVIHNRFGKDKTQTVKVTVMKKGEPVAFNASEPAPGRFDYPTPPPSVDAKAVMAIVREIQVPPVKSFRADAPPPSISDILPFSEEAMKPYVAGELALGEKGNPLQQAVLEAVEEIRKIRSGGGGTDLPEEFGGETSDKAKEELRKVQEIPARVEAILQDALDKLEAEEVASLKEKQVKRWQVHYDYVIAQLKLRICYVNQYNLALANVRGGKLPDLKEGDNGFRLSAESTLDKNTPANYKDMFADARKILTEMPKQHPNTPWALLAKSDRTVAIGLRLTGSSVTNGVR